MKNKKERKHKAKKRFIDIFRPTTQQMAAEKTEMCSKMSEENIKWKDNVTNQTHLLFYHFLSLQRNCLESANAIQPNEKKGFPWELSLRVL